MIKAIKRLYYKIVIEFTLWISDINKKCVRIRFKANKKLKDINNG